MKTRPFVRALRKKDAPVSPAEQAEYPLCIPAVRALSPLRQMAMLTQLNRLVNDGCQLVIATHSPILLAYPRATIYQLDEQGITRVAYEQTDAYRLTRDFLNRYPQMLVQLLTTETEE